MKNIFSFNRITAVLIAVLLISCGKDGGGSSGPEKTGNELDYSRLTKQNHPRLLMDADDFIQLKTRIASGSEPRLTQLHTEIMRVCDNLGMNSTPLAYQLDAGNKRLLSVSREALLRIFTCAYAYRMTGETQYLERAEANINTVCNFADWNARKHFLDVGEMTAAVALGYDWLFHDLQTATKEKIVRKINEYAFYPADNKVWNLNFFDSRGNWNQVCIGGLICGALAVYEELPSEAKKIIAKGLTHNKLAMQEIYSPDGNYPEGYGYWAYGTLYQVLLLGVLESCFGHDGGLSSVQGFDRTAEYMLFMEGLNRKAFNYSDGGQSASALMAPWWFARKHNNAALLYHELTALDDGRYYSNENRRLLPMIITFAKDVQLSNITPPDKKVWSGAGKTPVVLIRTAWGTPDDKYLGIKGGMASTSHGHMDSGSFVYDAEGLRWAIDLGSQSYSTLETHPDIGNTQLWNMGQTSKRWSVFRIGQMGHGTLTINGARHRVDANAPITEVINTTQERGAVVDLSATLAENITSAVRTVKIVSDRDLVVIDRLKARTDRTANVRWAMVTPAIPSVKVDYIELTQNGKKMKLTVSAEGGTPEITLKTWSTRKNDPDTQLSDWDADNANTYMVGFEAALDKNQSAVFTTTLTPAN